ncbi:MAG: NAD(P)-binding domain-containing protein [Flavobacteriaceae bacterium]|nr:NAD(P)-binding domain-containing protein [Flavobacteriaceae bacterium]
MKKVGILGSGVVGQTLGNGFLKHGYEVMIGTRDPNKLAEWKSNAGQQASIGSFKETVQFSNLIVLSVKGTVAEKVISSLGSEALKGKVIIDATNPIEDAAPENGVLRFFTDINKSLMETLQEKAPDAHFVKAFNSISSVSMVNPKYENKPTMFICGNNEDAKKQVSEILDIFGFEVEDFGTAQAARAIEPLCMLFCIPGFLKNQWTHAYRLMHR